MIRRVVWIIAAAAIGTIVRQGIWKATESPRSLVPQHSSSPVLSRFPARVNAVFDGDTILVTDATGVEHRIRFSGVDAPELAHDGRPAQPGGQEALRWLRGKVQGQVVVVEVVDRDKLGQGACRALPWGGQGPYPGLSAELGGFGGGTNYQAACNKIASAIAKDLLL